MSIAGSCCCISIFPLVENYRSVVEFRFHFSPWKALSWRLWAPATIEFALCTHLKHHHIVTLNEKHWLDRYTWLLFSYLIWDYSFFFLECNFYKLWKKYPYFSHPSKTNNNKKKKKKTLVYMKSYNIFGTTFVFFMLLWYIFNAF